MFGKEKEAKPLPNSFLNQMMEDDDFEVDNNEEIDTDITTQVFTVQSETVLVIEKISTTFAPYFIVVVGLYLYEKAWLLGIILMTLGIISLLKINLEKIDSFLTWLKQTLGYDTNEEI